MNWMKEKVKNGAVMKGVWLELGSPAITEIAGLAGFDWGLLDMEHGIFGEDTLFSLIQGFSKSSTTPIVRLPDNNPALFKRALDMGAGGIMVPMVNSAAEAKAAVEAAKYPPEGKRGLACNTPAAGFGIKFNEYFTEANENVTLIMQIETVEGLKNVDEIAAVDGVDIVFLGHVDMSLDLGKFQPGKPRELGEAEQLVAEACRKHGKQAGMIIQYGQTVDSVIETGFKFIGLGSDTGCLVNGFKKILS
jgi:2-keto-3-deoxy-L-rhamnonate aldolase RhmA